MATKHKPPAASLADDWEDVDDAYSVVSLPSSDDEDSAPVMVSRNSSPVSKPVPDPASKPEPELAEPMETTAAKHQSQGEQSISNNPFTHKVTKQPEDPDRTDFLLGMLGTPLPQKQPPVTPPNPWQSRQLGTKYSSGSAAPPRPVTDIRSRIDQQPLASNWDQRGLKEDLDRGVTKQVDSHTNPAIFVKVLDTLTDILAETSSAAEELRSGSPRTAERIAYVCRTLTLQIKDLRPIVSSYAKHWERSSRDIPLDPGIYEWMSGLRVKLLGAQGIMHECTQEKSGNQHWAELEEYADSLGEFEKHMDDFLPIMQVDFNEYETNNLKFPTQSVPETRSFAPPPRSTDQVGTLRTELYELKDQIRRAIALLQSSREWLPPSVCQIAVEVIQSFGFILDAISFALTNHGSEWIEAKISGRAGGISFEDFCALDPNTIRDFVASLRRICDLLHIDRISSGSWSPEMIREHHQSMLVEGGNLDALESIATVLAAILMPNHTPGHLSRSRKDGGRR